jgi:hypothetical protein
MILESTFCNHKCVVSYNFSLMSHVFLAVRFISQQNALQCTEFSVYISISSISCFHFVSILLFDALHGQWSSIHTQRLRFFDSEITVSRIISNYTQQSSSWESIAALLTKIYLGFIEGHSGIRCSEDSPVELNLRQSADCVGKGTVVVPTPWRRTWRVQLQHHSFLTSRLDGSEW